MSAPFYTTRELQALLQVDRTTIYRMADAGRLPALKVGGQWRFPRRPIDLWLGSHSASQPSEVLPARSEAPLPASTTHSASGINFAGQTSTGPSASTLAQSLPLDCIQLIQDSLADALGVMIVVTDMDGRPLTKASNTPGLIRALESHPLAWEQCLQWWTELARMPNMQPAFLPGTLGLHCARAFFRSGSTLKGMVVIGAIAPEPWPPSSESMQRAAEALGIAPGLLERHQQEVVFVDAVGRARLLDFVQRFADIVTRFIYECEPSRAAADSAFCPLPIPAS